MWGNCILTKQLFNNYQSGRRGSNPRRPAWEAGILPLNYSRSGDFLILTKTATCRQGQTIQGENPDSTPDAPRYCRLLARAISASRRRSFQLCAVDAERDVDVATRGV